MKKILYGLILLGLLFPISASAEPLQNDLFVVMSPQGMMGKSPLYPVFRTADSSNQLAKKYYDAIINDPKMMEVVKMYRSAQDESNRKYKAQLLSEGKSAAEIERLMAGKADPIYFICKNGKTTPHMESGSAFIQTFVNGKIDTNFHYVCPKVSIYQGWEGFSTPADKPFGDYEKKEFSNLICHETSHAIMKETYGFIPKGANPIAGLKHWEGKESTAQLAFTEGYAEFMGAWFSGSEDYGTSRFTKNEDYDYPKSVKENKRTEGVVACTLWDIAAGDHGIIGGMDKIHRIFREKKPWTVSAFAKGFKEMYPEDSKAIDLIVRANTIPEKEKLIVCWFNLNGLKGRVERLQKEYDALSWFKNPIKKTKAWWNLRKSKSALDKMLARYQSMYGYTLAELTSAKPPIKKAAPVEPQAQATSESGTKAKVSNVGQNPFSE